MPVEVSAIGMTDEQGRFARHHGSTRDMTERERLERDLRQQAAELAAGEERAHLARELHDSVTQALFSMTLLTRTIEMLLDRDPRRRREAARLAARAPARGTGGDAGPDLRAPARQPRAGRPDQGAADPQRRAPGPDRAADRRRGELAERLPIALEEVLYRIAQEALHNIVKHAGARQVAPRAGARAPMAVRLRIVDDGKGFDPDDGARRPPRARRDAGPGGEDRRDVRRHARAPARARRSRSWCPNQAVAAAEAASPEPRRQDQSRPRPQRRNDVGRTRSVRRQAVHASRSVPPLRAVPEHWGP